MAGGARLSNLEEAIALLSANQQAIQDNQRAMQEDFNKVTLRLSALEAKIDQSAAHSTRSFNLDIPHFDGSDPLGWTFKIDRFFDYHQTDDEQRIIVACFCMDGPALSWYRWMHKNGQLHSWPGMLRALELRFGPSEFEDPQGLLFKLAQTGTVKEYKQQFEALSDRIVGLPEKLLVSCFISGLKPDIRRELQAFQPESLSQAIGLAKLQEEKFQDQTREAATLGLKRSTANLLTLREKGLCFNCDERFHDVHKCKARFLPLLTQDDSTEHNELYEAFRSAPITEDILASPKIGLHASGYNHPRTLKLLGKIASGDITVLVDGGSTHNFIQSNMVHKLGLQPCQTDSFMVIVGNREELPCSTICKYVTLNLQGQEFQVDLYVLPLSGAEVVLGAQWLKALGPIIMDYSTLMMQFMRGGKMIKLSGTSAPMVSSTSLTQSKKTGACDSVASYYQLQMLHSRPWGLTNHMGEVAGIHTGISHVNLEDKMLHQWKGDDTNHDHQEAFQEQRRQLGEFNCLHRDMLVNFVKWDFDPMELDNPFVTNGRSVHLWHRVDDLFVPPVTISRYISQKLPWIHYHEINDAGHMFTYIDGMSDTIVKVLLMGVS